MKSNKSAFQDNFWLTLEKCSDFTKRELFALWAIVASIINNHSFSFSAVSIRFGRKVGRNFLSKVLKKYAYVQRRIAKLQLQEIVRSLPRSGNLFLVIDDQLVQKRGKQIFGSLLWYDHTQNRVVRALGVVNVAVVYQNRVLFFMPWLLFSASKKKIKRLKKAEEQDAKTTVAIELLDELIQWLKELGVSEKRIVIEADSWYDSKPVREFLDTYGVNYRIAAKKNFSVQVPDNQAVKAARVQIRGRKRTRFVKYVRLDKFMRLPKKLVSIFANCTRTKKQRNHSPQWHHFTDERTGKTIYHSEATLTLKTWGRTRVYAFLRDGCKEPLYIMTRALTKHPPDARTIYRDYSWRWRIEEAHKDLKQHFGLGWCQARDAWVVHGFIGLIYFVYSIFKFLSFKTEQTAGISHACPTWAEKFHKWQIYEEMSRMA